MDDEEILEAARTIRSVLAEIPGVDDPLAVDATLAVALSHDDAAAARAELWQQAALRRWVKGFGRLGVPPESVVEPTRGIAPGPPGHGEVVAAPRFSCMYGDFVWYRRTAAATVPLCPTHGVRVVPEPVTGR